MAALRSLAALPVDVAARADRRRPQALDVTASLERLADRAGSIDDLRLHGLQLVAARTWRDRGRLVPRPLLDEDRRAGMLAQLTPTVLRHVRAAVEGPLVLLDGPEAAARYSDPALRPYDGLELLVASSERARRALLAAGFVEADARATVAWPGLPLSLEIHERPTWIGGREPPARSELLDAAVPSATGIEGILALGPAEHVLVLAARSWARAPLGRVLELADIALAAEEADREELCQLAARWGIARLWQTTERAADALFRAGHRPLALHLWAGNLARVGERTRLESTLQRRLAPFAALPARAALRSLANGV